MIKELSENTFDEAVSTELKLVEFFATWCSYCQKQKPIIEEISNDGVWVGLVDADKNLALIRQYNIVSFPSFIIFKNGEMVKKFSGFHTKNDIMKNLSHYIK